MGLRAIFVLCLFGFIACGATAKFPFRVYGIDAESYSGKLLGPTDKDDLPLSECKPDAKVNGKCVVILRDEFFRLKSDYLDVKQKLLDLQKRCPSN